MGGAEDLTVLAAVLPKHTWYHRKTIFLAAKIHMYGAARKLKWVLISGSSLRLVAWIYQGVVTERGCDAFRRRGALRWTLSQPPCSVGSAATSTSSSERLSPLRSSSWYTGISSASGLGHGSPTSLSNTDKQHLHCMLRPRTWNNHLTRCRWERQGVRFLSCTCKIIRRWPQLFNFVPKNVFHHSSKGLSCLTVSVYYISSGASNPNGSSAAPAVLMLGSQQSPPAWTWIRRHPPQPCSWQFPATYRSAISLPPPFLPCFLCSLTPPLSLPPSAAVAQHWHCYETAVTLTCTDVSYQEILMDVMAILCV